jgi:hypothetical protein
MLGERRASVTVGGEQPTVMNADVQEPAEVLDRASKQVGREAPGGRKEGLCHSL